MNPILQHWNGLPAAEAEAAILPTNGSPAWAAALTAGRPYADPADLVRTADHTWSALPPEHWQDAFETHPRIGERDAIASPRSLAWSDSEQSAAASSDEDEVQTLHIANLAYEARFDRVFLIRAAGRTRPEILASLASRMQNTPEEELLEAAEQQRQITLLRLQRWLEGA